MVGYKFLTKNTCYTVKDKYGEVKFKGKLIQPASKEGDTLVFSTPEGKQEIKITKNTDLNYKFDNLNTCPKNLKL